jgi:hypothetical protein
MTFTKMDKQQAIGMLKARGTTDPDVLYGSKQELTSSLKTVKNLMLFPIIVGLMITIFMTITLIGIPVAIFFGLPVTIIGFWLRGNAKKNIATVESAYWELTGTVEASPQPSGPQAAKSF